MTVASASAATPTPVLPLDRKVLFPRAYLRVSVTSAAALALLKDLVWDGRAGKPGKSATAKALPSAALTLAVFTKRVEDPSSTDNQKTATSATAADVLYPVGTLAKVIQLTRSEEPSGGLTMLLQGVARVQLGRVVQTSPYLLARVTPVALPVRSENNQDISASVEQLKALTQEYMALTKSGSAVLRKTVGAINGLGAASVGQLADVVVAYMDVGIPDKQRVLEAVSPMQRCMLASELLLQAIQRLKLQQKIASTVQDKLEGTRKEFLLRQQLEAIKKELGETDDDAPEANEIKQLEDRLHALTLDEKASKVAQRELRRLKNMSPSQPEHSVIHNYLEFFVELPWNKQTKDSLSVRAVQKQLDADHYGLERVKKRITEDIAVRSLTQSMKGPILCLVGPPGVGKTSLGKSIAAATNRKFERIALGGVHDESEIRGHRRTYIGAMPGCIMNALRHADSKNPVILLDEVDKIGKDFRGDPSSALLEVLDPHQNHTFSDHYLNVPFDLSNVLFIATANSLATIPGPLLDRMEVIDVSGYSVEQKMEITKRYLLPRQIAANGLDKDSVRVSDDTLRYLIMSYTREAGVRNLERQVGAICRSVAVSVVKDRDASPTTTTTTTTTAAGESSGQGKRYAPSPAVIDKARIRAVLGHEMIANEVALRSGVPGVATGMSWSTAGGAILFVEASCTRLPVSSSNGAAAATSSTHPTTLTNANAYPRLHLTGKLGDVMKESAQLALSWLRGHVHLISPPAYTSKYSSSHQLVSSLRGFSLDGVSDVHVHFPEGATPKDGPSAGCAIVCALLSVISSISVPPDMAMTGEMTLRGVILPVGGIREKVLAAIRAGIKRVVLPRGNQAEAEELKAEFARAGGNNTTVGQTAGSDVQILFVSDLKELLKLVFGMTVHSDVSLMGLEDLDGDDDEGTGQPAKQSPMLLRRRSRL